MGNRWRTFILLCLVPLMAFQCVPSPLIRASVTPNDPASEVASRIALDEQAHGRAGELAKSFASHFDLTLGSCPLGWQGILWEDECTAYSRMRDEGIMLLISHSPKRRRSSVVLIKEARFFGTFTKHEAEEQLRRLVLAPLVNEFGEQNVKIEQ